MATAHDPDTRDLTASFERFAAMLTDDDLELHQQTALREFEQDLRQHLRTQEMVLARYEFLFEAAPDPYVVTDPEGTITEVNAAARSFLGVDASTPARRNLADFVCEHERPRYFGWLEHLRAGAPEARWDTEFSLPGHPRPIPVEIHLADDLDGIGYRWVLRDQRERAAAEQNLRTVAEREHRAADELRSEARVNTRFLVALSHDLRGPIGALLHQAELLMAGALADDVRERSRAAMEDNARLLAQLLESLVDIERYALGEFELRRSPIEVATLVDRLRRSEDEDGIDAPEVDRTMQVHMDLEVMRRAMMTVVNALKSTDGGNVELEVRDLGGRVAIRTTSSADQFSVNDDRVDIRLARALVEMHGGTLHYTRSDDGQTVTVTLPTIAADSPG